ncbi:transport protein particle component-domain-containing protein [Lipomyces arxii]|uniref:transport protein particle component-domain-containing protein n=1 Tax=Lipomyces arxii TaxID=56418 RepID=UPI0034CD307E
MATPALAANIQSPSHGSSRSAPATSIGPQSSPIQIQSSVARQQTAATATSTSRVASVNTLSPSANTPVVSAANTQNVAVSRLYTDPHAVYLSLSCLDFLLIELIPMSERVVEVIGEKTDDTDSASVILEKDNRIGEEERKGALYKHVEGLGYRVGQGLVERFSQDRSRFTDVLDVVKFICKDLWQLLFRKQIDNLKTNHRGVYVLTDSSFRLLTRMSTESGGLDTVTRAQPYLWFPCGVLRGALANLGVQATVIAETTAIPVAVFHIQAVRQEEF